MVDSPLLLTVPGLPYQDGVSDLVAVIPMGGSDETFFASAVGANPIPLSFLGSLIVTPVIMPEGIPVNIYGLFCAGRLAGWRQHVLPVRRSRGVDLGDDASGIRRPRLCGLAPGRGAAGVRLTCRAPGHDPAAGPLSFSIRSTSRRNVANSNGLLSVEWSRYRGSMPFCPYPVARTNGTPRALNASASG